MDEQRFDIAMWHVRLVEVQAMRPLVRFIDINTKAYIKVKQRFHANQPRNKVKIKIEHDIDFSDNDIVLFCWYCIFNILCVLLLDNLYY